MRIQNSQAEDLKEFLIEAADIPDYQIQQMYIDDCGMNDYQFAQILEGLKE